MKDTFQVDQSLATIEMVLANAGLRTLQQIVLHVAKPSGHPQWHQPYAISFGELGFEVVQQGVQDPVTMASLEFQQAVTQCTVVIPSAHLGRG